MDIAVLITTFNRKEKTLACLQQLNKQTIKDNIKLTVYLTDDASEDGTAEAAAKAFPDIHIYHGNGSLFWAGGMRNSWKEAMKDNPDYFLLLNDDTLLFEDSITKLLQVYKDASLYYSKPAIVVGSTRNSKGKTTYGGRTLISPKKTHSQLIENNESFAECDLGNANIMLVPREIVQSIGILSDMYVHGIADFDYTLTAKENGFSVVVAPGTLGACEADHGKSWKSANVKLRDRIKYLYSPKGLAYKEYLYFIRKHFPSYYLEAFTKLWLKTLFPFFWDTLKK